jgi:bifunctional non-homologous end joining protein LigD
VRVDVGGRRIGLTSLDKQLWPGFTKRDLVDYYVAIAPVLLSHLTGRAVTLGRFPAGVFGPGFAQTECRGHPEWVPTRAIRLRDGRVRHYCLIEEPAALAWLANLGTLELHPFMHRADPDSPDFVVFDLDPGPGAGIARCCELALRLREVLREYGLAATVKTSGGDGLHVYVPLAAGQPYALTRRFAKAVATRLAIENPELAVDRTAKAVRGGWVLCDWAQNNRARSMIAAYSPRAANKPWISTPVSWREVERADAPALRFLPADVLQRVAEHGDLFATPPQWLGRLPDL